MANIFQRIEALARKRAMADIHPETTTRQHIMSIRSDSQMLAPFSYLEALTTHETHVWVKKAVTIISDNACTLPLYVTRGDQRVNNHAALQLLNHPNDKMSAADLWRWWAVDMLLGGEEGWEIVRDEHTPARAVEIWPRQPHVFAVEKDPLQERYYGVNRYEIDDGHAPPYFLPPDEFVHFKFFNPRNPWRGIGVLLALRLSVMIDVFAQAWERFLFQNNARPDYAVVTPQGTTRTERDDIEKKIAQKYGGPENAGKVIALEEGITDIKVLSFRPKDLGELELRKMSRDEIAGGFGVPDILMGFGADTYDTEAKRTAAISALYSLTIKPLLSFRDVHLTMQMQRLKVLRPDETLHTDYSGVTELQEHSDSEWARAKEQIDRAALTINDWRKSQGQPGYPWGDVAWLDANKIPISGAALPAPADGKAEAPSTALELLSASQIAPAADYTPQLINLVERLFEAYVRTAAQTTPAPINVHVPAQPPVPVDLNVHVTNDVQPAAILSPSGQPVLIQNQVVVRPELEG